MIDMYNIKDRYDAIAFDQKRYIRSNLKEIIFERNLYMDFTQSILEGACIARNEIPLADLDKKDGYRKVANIVNRCIYRFLTENGFKRERGCSGYKEKIKVFKVINLSDSEYYKRIEYLKLLKDEIELRKIYK